MENSPGQDTDTETPGDYWRRLIEIEKECAFEGITSEDLLISKIMTVVTEKKLQDTLMEEKKLELKKTIEMIKANTYERKIEKTQYRKPYSQSEKKKKNNAKDGTIRDKTEKQNDKGQTMQIL